MATLPDALTLAKHEVEAVIVSILASTLGLSRQEFARFDGHTRLDGDIGVDSIDLLSLAKAVSSFFDLYESGAEELLLQRRTVGGWTQTVLEAWDNAPPYLTFRTSGSTGEPAECRHTLVTLHAEIEVLAALFAGRRRIVGIVPRHHIYGFLFTVLLPDRLGLPFLELRGASVSEIHRELQPGDVLIGFPLRWDDLSEARLPLVRGVLGVTSTGPCNPKTIAALRALGLDEMFEIYGSSQTAGIAWRTDPAAPYRLFPYWTLTASGEALVRNDSGGTPAPLPLPDRVQRRGEGFEVVGRLDGAISVGGVNVFPARIAATIRTHPDVTDCTVRPMRADEGRRLKAFVVLRPSAADSPEAQAALRHWLGATFSAAECPKPVTFGSALPRDAQGKPSDW
ncbi:MAG: hypothetical protein NVS2B17_11280 [Candidatus Velthaea sp.]